MGNDVRELLDLILVEMSRATNADLACDGPVGDEEGKVWRRIEAKAREMDAIDPLTLPLDSFYRNGIYEALRQSKPEVEQGKPIVLTGQDLLDMTAAVWDYLHSLPVELPAASSSEGKGE